MVLLKKNSQTPKWNQFLKNSKNEKIDHSNEKRKSKSNGNISLCSADGAVGGESPITHKKNSGEMLIVNETQIHVRNTRLQSKNDALKRQSTSSLPSIKEKESAYTKKTKTVNADRHELPSSKEQNSLNEKEFVRQAELRELIKSVQFLSNAYDEINQKMNSILSENVKLKSENIELKKNNDNLNEQLLKVKANVNDINQENLAKSVSIKGLTKLNESQVKENVFSLGNMANVQISECDINTVVQYSNENNSSISTIVKFHSLEKRNIFLKEVKKQRVTQQVKISDKTVTKPIYINECLTRDNYLLLSAAVKLKRFGVKFVWTQNGNVLIRQNENKPIVRIKDMKHINAIEETLLTS